MRITRIAWCCAALALAWGCAAVHAQPLRLAGLPGTAGNTRFFRDVFQVRYPSLSLNGFTCAGLEPGGCAYGLGLTEVLRAVYEEQDPAVKDVYEKILGLAEEALVRYPGGREAVLENTQRIQARAFVALATYVLEQSQNDYDNEDAARPLSCYEKGAWFAHVAYAMCALDELAHDEVFPYVRLDEVQPGNWPMKVWVALGYAALPMQRRDRCYPDVRNDYPAWLDRALESAGAPAGQDRSKHWSYQTSGARRFFAEGPYYFHLVLSEILPFWHALRLNAHLHTHPDVDPGDPFRAAWFTRPLHALAALATPDGRLPPLDDDNKVDLREAAVMRWAPGYGDDTLGRAMAWIADRQQRGWGVNRDLMLVEIALPRLGAGEGVPPPETVGNTAPEQTGPDGEQQVVLRRTASSGAVHYVLVNGESGDAVRRGEGHEQGDQMQLLYYVDDVSYLVDSGYDHATGLDNSTWNHYGDHNVMSTSTP